MSKRKNIAPVNNGSKRQKVQNSKQLVEEKFNILSGKLQELGVSTLKLSFISSIATTIDNQLKFIEFLEQNDVDQQPKYIKYLVFLEQNNIKFTTISSILNGAGNKAPDAFNLLCQQLFNQQSSVLEKSKLLLILEQNGIFLSNISSMLNGAKAKAPDILKALFNLLFDEQNGTKSDILKTFEENETSFTNISSILSGARDKAPDALQALFKLLFDEQNGTKSDILKTFEENETSFTNISSILSRAGAKAPDALQASFKVLFVFDEQNGKFVKSPLLLTFEKSGVDIANISSMLNGAGAKAPDSLKALFDQLFTRQGDIYVKSKLLLILEQNGIFLSNKWSGG